VLGPAAGFMSPGGPDVHIGVSPANLDQGAAFPPQTDSLPGVIPPHQTRAVLILWTSTTCLDKGSSQGIDTLLLKVRIGRITRTEDIPLGSGWYLSGPSHGACT
jgi:hypothetical protein